MAANEWIEGKAMPTARGGLNANFVDGILYAVGGQGNSTGILAVTEAYDPITGMWSLKSPMPTARHHAASATVDDRFLYVIGGRVGDIYPTTNVNVNEVYDSLQDKWLVLEPMPTARSGIAASAVIASNNNTNANTIHIFGGEETSKTFDNNEKYDTVQDSWSSDIPLPTARHGLAAQVGADGKIYVIGGGPEPNLSFSNVTEIFEIK